MVTWDERIESARRSRFFSKEDVDLAFRWETCPAGFKLRELGIDIHNIPEDLKELGAKFVGRVSGNWVCGRNMVPGDRYMSEAIEIYEKIKNYKMPKVE